MVLLSIESHVATREWVCGRLIAATIGRRRVQKDETETDIRRRSPAIDRSCLSTPKSRRRRFTDPFFTFTREESENARADRKDLREFRSTGKEPRILESRSFVIGCRPCTVSNVSFAIRTHRVAPNSARQTTARHPAGGLICRDTSLRLFEARHRAFRRRTKPDRHAPPRLGKHPSLICTFEYRGFREARSPELDTRGRVTATPTARVRAHFA